MNKFGQSAVKAVEIMSTNKEMSPVEAWQIAVSRYFRNSPSSQIKSCPKSTFLGLCESGQVKGTPKGIYTKSKDNKCYALKALELLRENSNQTAMQLWEQVSSKTHNDQMNVVLALFNQSFIE